MTCICLRSETDLCGRNNGRAEKNEEKSKKARKNMGII